MTTPANPVISWNSVLPKLRAKLSRFLSAVTTVDDLMPAKTPSQPLFVSGACSIQAFARGSRRDRWNLLFAAKDLGRRMTVDLGVAKVKNLAISIQLNRNSALPDRLFPALVKSIPYR